MSYINEALKKAQKDKDANHLRYIQSIGRSGRGKQIFDNKFLLLGLIIISLIIFASYFGFGMIFNNKVEPTPKPAVSSAEIVDSSVVQNISEKAGESLQSEHKDKGVRVKKDNFIDNERRYKNALSQFKKGNTQKAKKAYREILSNDPGHIKTLNDLGVILLHEGAYETAINHFEKAIRLKPKYVNSYYNLACVYALNNSINKGIVYLSKAVELDVNVKAWIREDSDLKNLRNSPEFNAIAN